MVKREGYVRRRLVRKPLQVQVEKQKRLLKVREEVREFVFKNAVSSVSNKGAFVFGPKLKQITEQKMFPSFSVEHVSKLLGTNRVLTKQLLQELVKDPKFKESLGKNGVIVVQTEEGHYHVLRAMKNIP